MRFFVAPTVAFLLIIVSCKKEEAPQPEPSSNNITLSDGYYTSDSLIQVFDDSTREDQSAYKWDIEILGNTIQYHYPNFPIPTPSSGFLDYSIQGSILTLTNYPDVWDLSGVTPTSFNVSRGCIKVYPNNDTVQGIETNYLSL